jgi:hypothetical protein
MRFASEYGDFFITKRGTEQKIFKLSSAVRVLQLSPGCGTVALAFRPTLSMRVYMPA